jgi:hypothetical protein
MAGFSLFQEEMLTFKKFIANLPVRFNTPFRQTISCSA